MSNFDVAVKYFMETIFAIINKGVIFKFELLLLKFEFWWRTFNNYNEQILWVNLAHSKARAVLLTVGAECNLFL